MSRIKPLKYPLDPEVCQKAARYAIRVAEEMSKRSILLNEPHECVELERDEILPLVGDLLGKGGFNSVYELETCPSPRLDPSKKYAIKFLSDDALYSNEDFCNGAADLFMESNYLMALSQHPHPALIQLHAISKEGPAGFSKPERAGFFIVIDRLYDTLDRRMEVWRELQNRNSLGSKGLTALFIQRLMVGQDVASALAHLHERRMIFRDLKPDNVGFDYEGKVKIYDFGLAKELDPKQKQGDLYHMSGGTGSRRFMAPEVALSQPYNLSADLYSFAILFWEILTLSKAFAFLTTEEHRERVISGTERLPVEDEWGEDVRKILQECWCREIGLRPKASNVQERLRVEIARVYAHEYKTTA